MERSSIELKVPSDSNLQRIDRFIINSMESGHSRSYLQKLIKSGNITVNGSATRPSYKVKSDDLISVIFPEPEKLEINPENIELNFVYQDDHIAVINKQPGIVMHPGPGNWNGTLVNALLYHVTDLSSIGDTIRPGIVHRLDKDTSGLLVIAKNDAAHRNLSEQFADRRVEKKYNAVVVGKPGAESGTLIRPLARHRKYRHKMTIDENGRFAETFYKIEKIWNNSMGTFSLVEASPKTGRTHQIRVHLSSMGNPIVGDPVYSKKWEKYRVPYLLLASIHLGFRHPESGSEMSFDADLPDHLKQFIQKLDRISM